ncbi:YkgJ family cysteine cluster protein [Dissulfurirhabdus thermomarina]|nr:YkgJ family cysteine cluster protein [Dissulfurirhabdus thermomarina]
MKAVFECCCCGHCCHGESTVSLTPGEQAAMARFLGMETGAFLAAYCVERPGRVEMRVVDGHCVFYGDDGLCRVHPVKPSHCRRWPLHPSILGDRGAWEAIRADCPGFDPDATYEEVCEQVRREAGG